MPDDYDLIIIGAGLAGLTAGIYASRQGLKTAIMERMIPGNQIINVEMIVDFPGFADGISGAELGSLVQGQAQSAGLNSSLRTLVLFQEPGPTFRSNLLTKHIKQGQS